MKCVIVLILVLVCSLARAQSDSAAIRLLDDPGIPTEDIDYIYDYLENTPAQLDSSARIHVRSSVIGGASESEKGFVNALTSPSNSFKGNAEACRNRLWLNSPRFIAALSEEKKSWEPNYMDRINGYLSIRSPIPITQSIALNQAAIGGYSMGFGSGLLFGDMGKTNRQDQASVLPLERGIRGSLSGDPFSGYFGGATTLGIAQHINVTGFYSSRKLDARVNGDSIVTLYEFADHRTEAELAMTNLATLTIEGARVAAFNSDSAAIGISGGLSAYRGAFDHYYSGTDSHPFIAKTFDAASIDLAAVTDLMRMQGEVAISSNDTMQRTMVVAEAAYHPSPVLGVAAAYRHIPFGIVSPFGRVFGNPLSALTNQDGYSLGIDAILLPKILRASAYADLSSDILPIRDEFGRQKYDYQLALHSTLEKWDADLTIRYQRGESTINTADSMLAEFSTQRLNSTTTRFDLRDSVSTRLLVLTRMQNVLSSNDNADLESGWFGEVGCKYFSENRTIDASIYAGRFSTASYRSAIWMFQQSVQGAGQFLALYGNGYYLSVGLQIHIVKILDVRVSMNQEYYDSWRTIGSGLTARNANSDQQFALQLDLRF